MRRTSQRPPIWAGQEGGEPTPPAGNGWFAPIATKSFAAVSEVIYAVTATIALLLSFGAGAICGKPTGWSGVIFFAPLLWLVGAAIRYKLSGVPIIRPQ